MKPLVSLLSLALALGTACATPTPTPVGDPVPMYSDPAPVVVESEEPPPPVLSQVGVYMGLSVGSATIRIRREGWNVARTDVYSTERAGTVLAQSPREGAELEEGETVSLRVSKGPAPRPARKKTRRAPVRNCHPSYSGACLDPNASDYDCAGGSGNGPKYVDGPVYVEGSDPYGLDRDGDGVGCE